MNLSTPKNHYDKYWNNKDRNAPALHDEPVELCILELMAQLGYVRMRTLKIKHSHALEGIDESTFFLIILLLIPEIILQTFTWFLKNQILWSPAI
jgi:hypothetical protein